jgi:hypothetical protein
MSDIDPEERNAARHLILKAVNAARIDRTLVPEYRMRHIQRAVHVATRKGLVKGIVLDLAGFNR